EDWLNFPYQSLFIPLGMDSAVFETDAHDNFVGSSLIFASARDWARFGQLLLQDGQWQGEHLLPEGWVEYMTSPNSTTNGGWYSNGFIWLGETGWNMGVEIPADDYWLNGFDGQYVVVIPSEDLVIVRMGLTQNGGFHVRPDFVGAILQALPDIDNE
ncbi:MAG: 6-aminohexanoate hydrolase, partial [Chloroflexota bacterium]